MANRYFVDSLPDAGEHSLTGETAHHLSKVLRVAAGDEIVLSDGRGAQCTATVLQARGRNVTVQLTDHQQLAEPSPQIHIAFAPPRLARADWLFEQGT